ncbi:5-formyltetrahydrofolate cyclo-ligase [Aestuariibius sp. 2305UL40-4]|uniref:5-formyltetrahydrofolate cyclo-ligase n=1 Tax=Aestuariibius violaceus TaxID=3234132 RepID=UPI00345ED600
MDKAVLRKEALARRAEAHAAAGPAASGRLSEVLAGHRGVPLAGYLPVRSEIDPLPVMAEASAWGAVGVPVVVETAHPLTFWHWTLETPLVQGAYGIPQPEADAPMVPEILIVPLVAFDQTGRRLGYGGGFYDRTLAALRGHRAILAIGFAYGAQELPELPEEPTDARLDLIVTDREVIEPSR